MDLRERQKRAETLHKALQREKMITFDWYEKMSEARPWGRVPREWYIEEFERLSRTVRENQPLPGA